MTKTKRALIVVSSNDRLGDTGKKTGWYLSEVTHLYYPLVEIGYTRHIAELRGRLQRMDATADPAAYQAAFAELVQVEGRRRTLRESA